MCTVKKKVGGPVWGVGWSLHFTDIRTGSARGYVITSFVDECGRMKTFSLLAQCSVLDVFFRYIVARVYE